MFLTIFLLVIVSCSARRLPDIFWNSTNPIFDISNTDHVKSVKLLDQITFICPSMITESTYEYSKLFAVSKEGYYNCKLVDEKLIGVCNRSNKQSTISIVFRGFSPLPGALEFQPGHTYYIITTSDGSEKGINNRFDGLCKEKHMKMKFEVYSERNENDDDQSQLTVPSVHFRHSDRFSVQNSTPLMYIIHNGDSSYSETYSTFEDDDGSSSVCRLSFALAISLTIFYLCS